MGDLDQIASKKERKRILLTVNPIVMTKEWCPTIRRLAAVLDKKTDLLVASIVDYDFKSKKVRAWKRIERGKFKEVGMVEPRADLWIVYSDGHWLDTRKLGFKKRIDFFRAQMDLHRFHLQKRNVDLVINDPATDEHTLKSWFAGLDPKKTGVIPTFSLNTVDEIKEFRRKEGTIVAKLDWGGASIGAYKLSSDQDIEAFLLAMTEEGLSLSDYCYQIFTPATTHKRFYIADGHVVGALRLTERKTPWQASVSERGTIYDAKVDGYARDRKLVEQMLKLSGLTIGAVDFIGDQINEINSSGTIFTYYQDGHISVDYRRPMTDSILSLINRL